MGSELVAVSHLSKTYRSRTRGPVHALTDVTFEIGRGEIVGLLGPNGAGKTTTIKSICGLVTPTSGTITIDGVDSRQSPRAASALLAAVLEGNRTVYWRLSVRENLEYFAGLRGLRRRAVAHRIDELIERFALDAKASTPAMHLSRGMQQKLALACAVLPQTPLLLLDEPTLGLDVETSHELRGYIRRLAQDEGRTVLLSSHDMQVVRDMCERVVVINDGHVVADDSIENLIALFHARAFKVALSEALPAPTEAALRAVFEMVDVAPARMTVTVGLSDAKELYLLVDVFREAGMVIESIDSTQPDLEQVFLALVKRP